MGGLGEMERLVRIAFPTRVESVVDRWCFLRLVRLSDREMLWGAGCSRSDVVRRFSISAFCGYCREQGVEMMRFLRYGRRCIEQEHGFSVLRFGIRDNL